MYKRFKDATAILLTLSLSFGCVPMTVFAQETETVAASSSYEMEETESISEEIELNDEEDAGNQDDSFQIDVEATDDSIEGRKDEQENPGEPVVTQAKEEPLKTLSVDAAEVQDEEEDTEEAKDEEYVIEESGISRKVTVTLKESVSGVKVAIWSSTGGQNDIRWYTLKGSENEWETTVDLSVLQHEGTVNAHFYTKENKFLKAMTFTADKSEISQSTISIGGNGATREIEVSMPNAVSGVRVAVWSAVNGQDDIKWYNLINSAGNYWSGNIDLSVLKHTGTVHAHVYSGSSFVGAENFTVSEDDFPKNSVAVSDTGTDRLITATTKNKASSVNVAVWSNDGGQDDIKWYSMKKQSDGSWQATALGNNLKHIGTCHAHVYADGKFVGNAQFVMKEEDAPKNTVSIADSGENRAITVTTNKNVSKVSVAIWSATGGQDDLVWYNLKKGADNNWTGTVKGSNLKHSGNVYAHVYSGSTMLTHTTFNVADNEVARDSVSIIDNGNSKSAVASISSMSPKTVHVAVWSHTNGQDDIIWYSLDNTSGKEWSTNILLSNLKHSGTVAAHFYANNNKFLGATTFTVSDSDMKKNEIYVTGSGATRRVNVSTNRSYSNVYAAVWSATGGQDDIKWITLRKNGTNYWYGDFSLANIKHSGSVNIHVYANNNSVMLGATSTTIGNNDLKLGSMTAGANSNIDYLQWAINIANNDAIGYGHTYPKTISCAGLVGLALTYCGYGDLIKDDPLGWGYIDLGAEYEAELLHMGFQVMPGVWSPSRYNELLPGDILYYYHSINSNHVGFYIGNGMTVEARGPAGSTDADSSGAEVAVYNWKNESLTFQKVYRLPQNLIHYVG